MRFRETYNSFLEYLEAKGHSQATITSYDSDARCFEQFLRDSKKDDEIKEISSIVICSYMVWMKRQGRAASTIKRKINSLSSYITFIEAQELIERNPMKRVDRRIKSAKKLPVFLTDQEVKQILNSVDNHNISTLKRDKAIIRTLIYTGIRSSELLNLNWENIDFGKKTLDIKNGKGGKDRVLPINPDLEEALWEYLNSRIPLFNTAVFLNRYNNRLNRKDLSRLLKRIARRANITNPDKVTARIFRHTFATQLIMMGVDIITIKELLGHKDVSTTQIYAHTSQRRLSFAVNELDWKYNN